MMSTFPKFWTCLAFEIIETKNHWKKKIEKLMGWIPCSGKSSKRSRNIDEKLSRTFSVSTSEKSKRKSSVSESKSKGSDNIVAQTFTFAELATVVILLCSLFMAWPLQSSLMASLTSSLCFVLCFTLTLTLFLYLCYNVITQAYSLS
ncbi:hypothetical protein Bca4012_012934 [Brassica carinata]